MGEAADLAMCGLCCEWCGVMFRKEHGHPVLCTSCWENATPEQREGAQRAREKEL